MSLIERHEKVPIETTIMTATSAAIGMIATSGPSTSNRNSRKTPDTKVESRLSPPDFTLMTDWPIRTQPPHPSSKPVQKLAIRSAERRDRNGWDEQGTSRGCACSEKK